MNRLQFEKSPYLLQHKDNPIHWYAWGEEAFSDARRAHRPIFLSIGYSTCHWCHVMAHESFEDQEVATFLNENFVCIKVDREERPDIDNVYMTALQALSGGGGWPMSVWLDTDGRPFFAGTYFPKYRFLQLLRRIHEIWTREESALLQDGERLTAVVKSAMTNPPADEAREAEYEDFLKSYISHFHAHFDERHGGFGGAPKFPQTMNLMVMMRQDFKTGLSQGEVLVTETLRHMGRGGIYDHLVGGFHRYSVDESWLVPHFEKMLYDQAMIATTLMEAGALYKMTELSEVARETLDYGIRDMTSADGRLYSAQDADSLNPATGHSEEGFFCTFTYDELKAALTAEEFDILSKAYGVHSHGNFEGRNILNLQDGFDRSVLQDATLQAAFAKLREIRAARPAPHLDDKAVTSWNGWMIAALAQASRAFGEPRYLAAAERALLRITEPFESAGSLSRFWRNSWSGAGMAEDYASTVHACLEVYQSGFDPKWSRLALDLQKKLDENFWNEDEGVYFSNDGSDPRLPLRPSDDHDGVHPGANSMAAYNLVRLYALTAKAEFRHRAERLFTALFAKLKAHPSSLPFLALALDAHLSDLKVAVLSGSGWTDEFYARKSRDFRPDVLWAKPDAAFEVARGKPSAVPAVFVCLEGRCLQPAENAEEANRHLLDKT